MTDPTTCPRVNSSGTPWGSWTVPRTPFDAFEDGPPQSNLAESGPPILRLACWTASIGLTCARTALQTDDRG